MNKGPCYFVQWFLLFLARMMRHFIEIKQILIHKINKDKIRIQDPCCALFGSGTGSKRPPIMRSRSDLFSLKIIFKNHVDNTIFLFRKTKIRYRYRCTVTDYMRLDSCCDMLLLDNIICCRKFPLLGTGTGT